MWYMETGTNGLQKMWEEFEAGNEGIPIPTQVQWLVNSYTMRERRQNGEIATSSVLFVVNESKLTQSLIKKEIQVPWDRYRVKEFTNVSPQRGCMLCCRWGHIEKECSSKPICCYCSGHHWRSNHKCNVVGHMAQQRSLCSHRLEKCPDPNGNDIAFRSKGAENSMAG
jgi:hypothetical protein